jgi:hypothetical protein
LYLVGPFRVDVDCLEANCELRHICLGFHSIVSPPIFGLWSCFWTLMGRSILIRDWELESIDIFMGRIGGLWWSDEG